MTCRILDKRTNLQCSKDLVYVQNSPFPNSRNSQHNQQGNGHSAESVAHDILACRYNYKLVLARVVGRAVEVVLVGVGALLVCLLCNNPS